MITKYHQMAKKWKDDHRHYKSPKEDLMEFCFCDIFYSPIFCADLFSVGDLKDAIKEVFNDERL